MKTEMDDLESRTMHVFISRALQKVLKEAPKKHVQLRQSCAAVIGEQLAKSLPSASLSPSEFSAS